MLRSTFALLATAVFLAGRAQAGNAYIGCLNPDGLDWIDGSLSISPTEPEQQSGMACAAFCAAEGEDTYGYSAWYPGALTCDCLPLGGQNPNRGDLPGATNWVQSIDTSGTCSMDDVEIWRLNTAWENNDVRCTVSFNPVAPFTVPRPVTTTRECFALCSRYRTMSMNPRADGSFVCRCAAGFTSAQPATCGQARFFLYGRSLEAAVSGVYRRSLKEKAKRQEEHKRRHQYCPEKYTACNIAGSIGYYECMDTSFELESCGGCVAGEFGSSSKNSTGTDCSRSPGVPMGATSCIEGKCVAYACKAGWTLEGGVCTKALKTQH